jgi:hypothetical protein
MARRMADSGEQPESLFLRFRRFRSTELFDFFLSFQNDYYYSVYRHHAMFLV